jgi:riboflavin synthase
MFTGIVEEVGNIRDIKTAPDGARLEIAASTVLSDAKLGDSIAVNGVCLTVFERGADWFAADLSAETLNRTSLSQARTNTRVNLERALLSSARLGGHIMQGHVDGTGQLIAARTVGDGYVVRMGFPPELGRYVVEKGSIAVDGISLTIAALSDEWFEIAIIPHTWRMTNLSTLARGAMVNLEVDIIAKYVERMMQAHLQQPRAALTLEKLSELGY